MARAASIAALPDAAATTAAPPLTVGLPVYNGERFVAAAIASYLNQTFGDFELVISDNASTDGTAEVCRDLARRDRRIRYWRNEKNLGAGPNFDKAYALSRATPFFKWTAADDAYAPTYLRRCMDALAADPTVVLCHARATVIDAAGRPMGIAGGPPGHYASGPATEDGDGRAARWSDHYDPPRSLDAADPVERYRQVVLRTRRCFEIWGVMRRVGLERTHGHESYYGSDKVMLSALSLAGRFVEVPERLYFRRHHAASSDSIKSSKDRDAWMDTRAKAKRAKSARLACLKGYRRSVAESDLSLSEKVKCYGTLARYLVRPERWVAALREPR